MSQAIIDTLKNAVADPGNKDKMKGINAVYTFVLNNPDKTFTLDLKKGEFVEGKGGKPDVTLTMKDADFVALMTGKANGQQMFMSGKIKFKGNMGAVMKLQQLQKLA
mmetsp:Transcript_62838/g.137674  ORF Transcript_62838/g.137674 Transcript_62838/m.137674 type:complete len:107 (+) Transcript_62838:57-377(+)